VKKMFLIVLSLFSMLPSMSKSEIFYKINSEIDSIQIICVVPFKWVGLDNSPENISEIIYSDLQNTGKFNLISVTNFLQRPSTASEVILSDWKKFFAKAIIIGKVQPSADNCYVISYQLVDVTNNSGIILIQNQYKMDRKWIRYAAHIASNEIFETLTNIKGAFCTRIAYIIKNTNKQYLYDLYISDYDGYNQILIHRSSEPIMSPAWSPDGNNLAYVIFENGKSKIIIQTLDKRIIYNVVNFIQHNGSPSWSPDGKKISFLFIKNWKS